MSSCRILEASSCTDQLWLKNNDLVSLFVLLTLLFFVWRDTNYDVKIYDKLQASPIQEKQGHDLNDQVDVVSFG